MLAEGLVKASLDALAGRSFKKVDKVMVSVGELAGVLPEALEFAFEALSAGTPLEGAQLCQQKSPVSLRCRCCGADYSPSGFPYICPMCASPEFEITGGEEVFVSALEITEE